MLPALLLFLTATPRPEAEVDWQLAQLRTWLSSASRLPGENTGAPFAGAAELEPGTCALHTTALLRSEARVGDAPEDSGMGFDFPGNLMQNLAAGSVGLSLGTRGSFRLCAFAASAPAENVLKSMRTAALRTLTPMPSTLMVGWVPERALLRRSR